MNNVKMGKTTRTFKVTANAEGEKLCTENPKRAGIFAYNNGTDTVYVVHAQSVPYTEGWPVLKGETYTNYTTSAALWVKTASGTQDVRGQEDGD